MTPRSHSDRDCRIVLDGVTLEVEAGLSVGAALLRAGVAGFSHGRRGEPRGLFCGMGACHDCLVTINGRVSQRACMTPVADGMNLQSQSALPDIADPDLGTLADPPEEIARTSTQLAVVGGGPAGLRAAEVAARAGIRTVLVDERHIGGGQFFKQPATAWAQLRYGEDRQVSSGKTQLERTRTAGVEMLGDIMVWGATRTEDGRCRLTCMTESRVFYLDSEFVILATGAYERVSAIPGWTLPGVMTAGAAQTLLRAYGTAPGQQILVAGNGPLNFQVARELADAGATVAGIVEAAAPPWQAPIAGLRLLAADPALATLGLRQITSLKGRGIAIDWNSAVTELSGTDRVKAATVATPLGEKSFEIDTVLLGGAFASDNSLSRLLGCVHHVVAGELVVQRTPDGETSQPDVHVIGEAGRFGGAMVAQAEGELAGRAAVRKLRGHKPDNSKILRRRARHLAFQSALWTLFQPAAPNSNSHADRIICRCEGVTERALVGIAESASRDTAALKRLSRAGMGRCQGRYCAHRIADVGRGPKATEKQGFLAPQMPVRPIPLSALAVEKPEWAGHKRALLPEVSSSRSDDPLDVSPVDVAVIGAGIAGISTALFLARAGVDVVVFDAGVANGLASGGNAGSLHAQLLSFDHGERAEAGGKPAVQTLPLQRDSIALWRDLQDELGKDFEMKITGGLMLAETDADLRFLDDKARVERDAGIECHVISRQDLRGREPLLNEGLIGAAYCPQEGKINPLVASQHLLEAARSNGARIFERCAVQAIDAGKDSFALRTTRGKVTARRVVNAAGAFAGRVGAMAGADIPVHGAPLQMVVTEAAAPALTALIAHADRHLTLKQAGNGNFIIGGGWTAGLDPVHRHPRPLLDSLEGNLWIAQHVLPGLRKLHIIRSWAAMNINIDGAPILGEDPRCPRFFHAVTSNGYTLGPLVGRLTADLLTGTHSGRGLERFSVRRFSQVRPDA